MQFTFPFYRIYGLLLLTTVLYSCNLSGPLSIFAKKSPHEQYAQKLTEAGMDKTLLGRSWFESASKSLFTSLNINIPYKETGYFAAERAQAIALRFQVKRGEKLTITLNKRPAENFIIYLDLLRLYTDQKTKLLAFADTTNGPLDYEVEDEGTYIIRLRPELLSSGEYTITITARPSLVYPIKAGGKNHIQSFFGSDRDEGSRRHEGIDLFAAKHTPVIAAAKSTVIRVNETTLGGKVVWLRPSDKNYNLYYAHLDSQFVQEGQHVVTGDALGLMGNTGNARTTVPHLHFGIYTFDGAIDPLPFVNPIVRRPESITAPLTNLGKSSRTRTKSSLYGGPETQSTLISDLPANTLFRIDAATANWYKITLPDGKCGYIRSSSSTSLSPIRSIKLNAEQAILDQPDDEAARKAILVPGESVNVLADFGNFYFITNRNNSGWINKNNL